MGLRRTQDRGARGLAGRRRPGAATPRAAPVSYHLLPAARRPRGLFVAMKTYVATPATRERNWLLVDANGQTLGRLSSPDHQPVSCSVFAQPNFVAITT